MAQAPVTDDTYAQTGKNANHGSESKINIQSPNINGFLRFNLSVYPSTLNPNQIEKATLRLFVNDTTVTPGTFWVCRLASNQPWLEGGLSGVNEPGCDLSTPAVPVTIPPAPLRITSSLTSRPSLNTGIPTPAPTTALVCGP